MTHIDVDRVTREIAQESERLAAEQTRLGAEVSRLALACFTGNSPQRRQARKEYDMASEELASVNADIRITTLAGAAANAQIDAPESDVQRNGGSV